MDIRGPVFRDLLVSKFDAVCHFAANAYVPPSVEDPKYDFHVNLLAPFEFLEVLRRSGLRPRCVVASSAAVYGNPVRVPISETDPTVPISPYGVSKLATERYVAVYCQLYGLQAACLRLFSAYAPANRSCTTSLRSSPGTRTRSNPGRRHAGARPGLRRGRGRGGAAAAG